MVAMATRLANCTSRNKETGSWKEVALDGIAVTLVRPAGVTNGREAAHQGFTKDLAGPSSNKRWKNLRIRAHAVGTNVQVTINQTRHQGSTAGIYGLGS